ncbi:RNA polymerase, sigma-24 subunit, ECF subfamily [Catenulispora acidiphila DSM 44928]|jgi:RNA polymerase sigma-70 factor (ECF subfamily)|uniref:RNA polymerase, sigma-24 subunit, ECF subfamily n=1 Tax=Catenulispora acidiphila (strain DSM 44928 / JCM 14897 / NBRC 102108 / NRRL B-24433 / ID139908) TaxID=479433 RepID=C7QCS7_CATAD|nr:SigE family RNA polymerase sigma factor [Catenulispora acidiphila]ACU76540.1 RNA polymerase, sigma-24 subunit, ECF subfamily [Catenulispora acidiphila DSM 44928]
MGTARSEADFEAFYSASSRRLLGHVYAMVGDVAEAEDALQEAYARAWQRWGRVAGYEDPEAWVRTVAYRIAVSSWRRTANRLRAHRRGARAEEEPGASPDRLALIAALRAIPAEQRRVIVLHHLVGLSVEEVAQETGAPIGTVKSRLARGRRALAGHVSEFADENQEAENYV